MINPLKKFETLKEAEKSIGFDICYPNTYKIKEIYTINDKILELRFASVIVRKARFNLDTVDISGVYPGAYPDNCQINDFKNNDIEGVEYFNGSSLRPRIYLSYWHDLTHKYSYSVYAKKGIELKSMLTWQKMLK